jgi:hypothetical protein
VKGVHYSIVPWELQLDGGTCDAQLPLVGPGSNRRWIASQFPIIRLPSHYKALCCPTVLCDILWPMSTPWFHIVAAIFLTACVFFFAFGNYYGYVMTRELKSRLPDSQLSWLRAWRSSPLSHRKYCPDSQTRVKWLTCEVAMVVCGFLGFFFWMKQ